MENNEDDTKSVFYEEPPQNAIKVVDLNGMFSCIPIFDGNNFKNDLNAIENKVDQIKTVLDQKNFMNLYTGPLSCDKGVINSELERQNKKNNKMFTIVWVILSLQSFLLLWVLVVLLYRNMFVNLN